MTEEIKTMTVDEFWKKGFLQEINRRLLNLAGMALSVIVDKETGEATGFGQIWDYREDPEGIINNEFSQEATVELQRLINLKSPYRQKEIGSVIQSCSKK
jgi:hypothetical protein